MKSPFTGLDATAQNRMYWENLVIALGISSSVGPDTQQIYMPLVDSDVLAGITAF
jgi:hypothetical protein